MDASELPPLKKPRVRSAHFSFADNEVLKTAVQDKWEINAKHCNSSMGVTKKILDRAWDTIALCVNSVGTASRSVKEVRYKWRNLTKQAKSEMMMQKISHSKTGRGPPITPMKPLMEEIAGMYSGSAAFHGIPGASDSKTMLTYSFDEDGFLHDAETMLKMSEDAPTPLLDKEDCTQSEEEEVNKPTASTSTAPAESAQPQPHTTSAPVSSAPAESSQPQPHITSAPVSSAPAESAQPQPHTTSAPVSSAPAESAQPQPHTTRNPVSSAPAESAQPQPHTTSDPVSSAPAESAQPQPHTSAPRMEKLVKSKKSLKELQMDYISFAMDNLKQTLAVNSMLPKLDSVLDRALKYFGEE